MKINKDHQTFLGGEMAQSVNDFIIWEELLEIPFTRLIEVGTWKGNLALYLKLYCDEKTAEFITYDVRDYEPSKMKKVLGFDKHFNKIDVFKSNLPEIIKKPGRTILFCDGGNKIKEFNTFSKYAKKGDLVGVHDWNIEVSAKDINLKGFKIYRSRGKLRFFIKL
jgi:hypothetical protein